MVVSAPRIEPQASAAWAQSWESLAGAPLPSRRQEDWRFDDLSLLVAQAPRPWSGPDPFADLRLPSGIGRLEAQAAATALDHVLQQTGCLDHWPVRLNAGAQPALLALSISAAAAAEPLVLELDAAAAGELLAVCVLLVLEPGASLDLATRLQASGGGVSSVMIAANLPQGANLKLAAVAEGHPEAVLLAHLPVLQAPGSELAITSVSSGWGFSRLEPRVVQHSGAARTQLRALQWVSGQGMADTHAMVRFEGPDGVLDQLHKTVADDAGRSIFNGAVQVPRAAQRTDAAQLSRSLLLSDRARVDTKPELEIVADDVQCAHGATISQLQSEELFYLQSRGIARDQASRLLLQGYCNEVLRELPAAAQAWHPLAAQWPES
ncbi:MAG: SufD family Fe-S cluster assembly protein [Cyanobacteriota bacterium]|nr:SufD family Fe-S cluster assembly protein [Cyanobacteriota bacterium]